MLYFTFPGGVGNSVAEFLSGDSGPAEKRRIQSQPFEGFPFQILDCTSVKMVLGCIDHCR